MLKNSYLSDSITNSAPIMDFLISVCLITEKMYMANVPNTTLFGNNNKIIQQQNETHKSIQNVYTLLWLRSITTLFRPH